MQLKKKENFRYQYGKVSHFFLLNKKKCKAEGKKEYKICSFLQEISAKLQEKSYYYLLGAVVST